MHECKAKLISSPPSLSPTFVLLCGGPGVSLVILKFWAAGGSKTLVFLLYHVVEGIAIMNYFWYSLLLTLCIAVCFVDKSSAWRRVWREWLDEVGMYHCCAATQCNLTEFVTSYLRIICIVSVQSGRKLYSCQLFCPLITDDTTQRCYWFCCLLHIVRLILEQIWYIYTRVHAVHCMTFRTVDVTTWTSSEAQNMFSVLFMHRKSVSSKSYAVQTRPDFTGPCSAHVVCMEAGSFFDFLHWLFHIIFTCSTLASCVHCGTASLDQIQNLFCFRWSLGNETQNCSSHLIKTYARVHQTNFLFVPRIKCVDLCPHGGRGHVCPCDFPH